ncbi:MAG: hypothetical protein EHM28_02300 [Spirochaetaceae bacterium]|nr:MAG: hypothetical protein EHM28_02300 [Spirochaetaceae bacterium]
MSGDGIERFSIAGNGTLSSVSMLTLAGLTGAPQRMNIDSTGAYAFVVQWAEGGDIGKIHQYGIVDSAGTLESLPTASISVSGLQDLVLYQ